MDIVPAAWNRCLGSVINGQGIMRGDIVREVADIPEEEAIRPASRWDIPTTIFPSIQSNPIATTISFAMWDLAIRTPVIPRRDRTP
jgi:hypothetical protein